MNIKTQNNEHIKMGRNKLCYSISVTVIECGKQTLSMVEKGKREGMGILVGEDVVTDSE